MVHRRIAYLGALGCAVLFQIFFRAYFSTFLLAAVLLLPVISLALSLPGMLLCAVELAPSAAMVLRGEAARFQAAVQVPRFLPAARVRLTLRCVNQLTGETQTLRRDLWGSGAAFTLEAPTRHCGRLLCTVQKARICGLLGLLSLPVRSCGEADLLVLPVHVEPDRPPDLAGKEQQGLVLRPRPGGGPGEDYDLRDYRPGDPMKTVHWKLSSKREDLVVKEVLEPVRAELYLTFDHFGPPERLDRTLDQVTALSRLLLEGERPHRLAWAHPETGEVEDCPVDAERTLLAALAKAMSCPAPLQGQSILEQPLPGGVSARRLHIGPDGVEGGEAS